MRRETAFTLRRNPKGLIKITQLCTEIHKCYTRLTTVRWSAWRHSWVTTCEQFKATADLRKLF